MSYTWVVDSELHSPALPAFGDVVEINLAPLIKNPNVSRIRIKRIFLPNLIYNVVTNNQNASITVAAVNYPIVVPAGYYDGMGLCATISGLFNVALAATTYVTEFLWDATNFLVTINVRNTAIPPPNFVPYTFTSTLVTPTESPDLHQLLGFNTNPLVSVTGTELSDGPLNVVADRYAIITCDEAMGVNGSVYGLGTPVKAWHDGVVSVIPLTGNSGDIIEYFPEKDSPWIILPKSDTAGRLTFHLGRDRYRYFGPTQISWTMILEVQ